MLRCSSNVGALRIGVQSGNIAMRIAPAARLATATAIPALRVGYGGASSRLSIPQRVHEQGIPGACRSVSTRARRQAFLETKNNPDFFPEEKVADEDDSKGVPDDAEVKPVGEISRNLRIHRMQRYKVHKDLHTEGKYFMQQAMNVPTKKVNRRIVQNEMQWLEDRKDLADRVAKCLKADDLGMAAALVRAATTMDRKPRVAWNHILQYCMQKNHPAAAFRFYNDMKKRGQTPTDVTYTVMLHGLAHATHFEGIDPIKTALSVYKSAVNNDEPGESTVIHNNAMLRVCSVHGDMETFWQIIGELPDDGKGRPDATTYTIILDAINEVAERGIAKIVKTNPNDVDGTLEQRAKALHEGKKVWSDVIYQWKNSNLDIDNYLVGAMARLLMQGGSERDFYDVFALFKQTMGIENLATKPRELEVERTRRQTQFSEPRLPEGEEELEDVPFVDENNRIIRSQEDKAELPEETTEEKTEVEVEGEEEEEISFEHLFDPVFIGDTQLVVKARNEEGNFMNTKNPVGNKDLTMILENCLKMTQGVGVAKAYWDYFTKGGLEHTIEPDAISAYAYLRVLRLGRSSRSALELVRDQMVPTGQITGKTFLLAFSCCRRDRKNINVFKIANELMTLMESATVLPDPRALEGYLELVNTLHANPQILMSLNGIADAERPSRLAALGRKLQFKVLSSAVAQLRPHVAKLHAAIQHGETTSGSRRPGWSVKQHSVPAALSLKVMLRARGFIDEILKKENASLLSKQEREAYVKESQELRVYSKKDSFKQFSYKTAMLVPTPDQILEKHETVEKKVDEKLNHDDKAIDSKSTEKKVEEKEAEKAEEEKA